jgi:hypothetical protein
VPRALHYDGDVRRSYVSITTAQLPVPSMAFGASVVAVCPRRRLREYRLPAQAVSACVRSGLELEVARWKSIPGDDFT